MASLAAIRVQFPNGSSDPVTPVPSLRNIVFVAQLEQQLVARLCILSYGETPFGYTLTEAIVWQGGCDYVE